MSLLSLQNIQKAYGDIIIIAGASLQIQQGEKIGLVGPNGAGKTTLLKIIVGLEDADNGEVHKAKGLSLNYLSQKPEISPGLSLEDYLKVAVEDIFALRLKMIELEKEMALPQNEKDPTKINELMEKYGNLGQVFEEKEGYTIEKRIQGIALGMGFKIEDMKRSLIEFSGGERTRAQLASLLLEKPELLLLDEPTNHLDLDAVEWLEGYLRDWQGALLVVSHDRFFLDQVVNRVASIEEKKLKVYKGNYSSYISQREIESVSIEKAYEKQQAILKKEGDFIRTATADERTKKQARSREKRLEKIDIISAPAKKKSMALDFDFSGRSGKVVVGLEMVSKYYGDVKVFEGADFEIKWGDRLALVGPNGAGKTTLLKVITGEESPSKGRIKVGPSVRIVYFDQEQNQLDLETTPLKTIMEETSMTLGEARSYLGRYLFREEEVFKKVGDLSGGEKSRLALARVAVKEGNFLVLDEPTNHLDIQSVEELESALATFPGTLLVVSHDRYFISRIAHKILEARDGQINLYNCNYKEYSELRAEKEEANNTDTLDGTEKISRREQREREKEERQKIIVIRRERRTLENRLSEIEREIEEEEMKVSRLEEQLADPAIYDNFSQARHVTEEFNAAKERVKKLYGEWENKALELDKFNNNEVEF